MMNTRGFRSWMVVAGATVLSALTAGPSLAAKADIPPPGRGAIGADQFASGWWSTTAGSFSVMIWPIGTVDNNTLNEYFFQGNVHTSCWWDPNQWVSGRGQGAVMNVDPTDGKATFSITTVKRVNCFGANYTLKISGDMTASSLPNTVPYWSAGPGGAQVFAFSERYGSNLSTLHAKFVTTTQSNFGGAHSVPGNPSNVAIAKRVNAWVGL